MTYRIDPPIALPSMSSNAVTFQFNDDVTHKTLSALYLAMVADFPSHAPDIFVINKNTTFDEDIYFVTFLENVLIIPAQYRRAISNRETRGRRNNEVEMVETAEFAIKIRGPKLASTNDIMITERSLGFSVVRNQPLFYVRENEEVDITFFTKYSTPRDHTKFRIVEEVSVDPRQGVKTIRIETTIVTTPQIVMDWALARYHSVNDNGVY